jgi:hypothetical protein
MQKLQSIYKYVNSNIVYISLNLLVKDYLDLLHRLYSQTSDPSQIFLGLPYKRLKSITMHPSTPSKSHAENLWPFWNLKELAGSNQYSNVGVVDFEKCLHTTWS